MRSNVCRAARRIHSFPRLSLSAADRRRSFEQQKVVRFPVCVAESREYLAGQQHPLTTVSRCRRFQPSTAPCPMLIVTPSFSRGAPPHALWRGAPLAQAPRTSSSRPRSAWGTSISPPPSVREPFAHIYPEDRVATGLVTAHRAFAAGSTMDLQRNRRIQSTSTPNDYIEFCSFTWEFAPIGPSAARIDLKLEFELLAAEHAILWDRLQDRILAEYLNCFQ